MTKINEMFISVGVGVLGGSCASNIKEVWATALSVVGGFGSLSGREKKQVIRLIYNHPYKGRVTGLCRV